MSEELSIHRKMYDDAAIMAAKSQILALNQLDTDGEVFRDSRGRILGSRDGTHYSDANLIVKFYRKQVLHKFKTIQEGKPVHVDQEFVTYFVPGRERELINDKPVDDYIRWRFRKEYEAFATGGAHGTPLSVLNLNPADVSVLNNHGIYTVEALTTVSDDVCKSIPNIVEHRSIADRYLKSQASAGNKELQERLSAQNAEIEELKKMVAALADKKSSKKAGNEE